MTRSGVRGGFEPAFGVDGGHAARPGRGDGLAVGVVLDVTAGEHPGDVGGGRAALGDEVAGGVDIELRVEQ